MFLKRLTACIFALMLLTGSAMAGEKTALNLLIIGVDSASPGKTGRSDTMMLAQIDYQNNDVRLVSFLRDLYVPIPGHGRTRLNAAYFYGGEELLRKTLKTNFGVEVDRTVTVHYRVLADLVDQLGGVEIDVTEAERRHLNKLLADYGDSVPRVPAPGLQRLSGLQALTYSRIRKIDSDFQRTSRQQTVIAAMLREMSGMGKWPLFRLAVSNMSKVQTDFTLGDLYRLAPMMGKLDELTITTAHVPFEGTYTDETISGMMVLKPNLEKNQKLLKTFLTE
ncbi:MAG: LCP family protein [Clostridia bacterium]|nr:LCP family protein [Clostridia bacterium]